TSSKGANEIPGGRALGSFRSSTLSEVTVWIFNQVPGGKSASIVILCQVTPGDPASSAALTNVPHASKRWGRRRRRSLIARGPCTRRARASRVGRQGPQPPARKRGSVFP